jgi:hypothetical protein
MLQTLESCTLKVRGFGFCKRSANLPPSLENDSHQLEKKKIYGKELWLNGVGNNSHIFTNYHNWQNIKQCF